ncbi:Farnesyl pyrophosphate synthase [Bagarius yarrelli]|uniref:Farnesyl pyrophosphate synthase n=1 Tax=Bagarius yarrelli TaxID=175774 RepID=A0A556V1S2_BAGYA|nr:Farnesyl pyrophosphate synthase [Bagarius yarrelli]
MKQTMLVILFMNLLKGFNQEHIILPPGPIDKEVGASVNFISIPSSLSISAIKWHFNSTDFIIYNSPGPETVSPQYQGRVVLNSTSGSLELNSLTTADSGRYTLTITFTNGTRIANYTSLQVFEPVLSFGINGSTGSLTEHSSVSFTCEGKGTISSTVWMKDSNILHSSSRIIFLNDNRTMEIRPLMRSDKGNYKCILRNPISSSTTSYSIFVNYGPDVRIFGVQRFDQGSDILLFCLADSEPYAMLRWTVNGEPVRDGDLVIRLNSKPSDSGEYKCTCWNNVTGITASAVHYVTSGRKAFWDSEFKDERIKPVSRQLKTTIPQILSKYGMSGLFLWHLAGKIKLHDCWQSNVLALSVVQDKDENNMVDTNVTCSKAGHLSDPQLFDLYFEKLLSELTEQDFTDPVLTDALSRLRKVLQYNATGGKRNRGLSVIGSLRELIPPSKLTPEEVERALLVGWCIELLQAFFLVADDIMDASVTRRGQPCWYKKEGIGLDAINDAFLLEGSIYRLLRRHCRGQPYYIHLLELFTETSFQTELGQALDLMTAPPNKIDLHRFTMDRYKAIVKYKTAFYSFYLPVAAAMYMAGIDSEVEHDNAKYILLEMGEFFQIQDDYLDCYGDPALTGKIGTDIQDNKCSWLVVTALRVMTPEQRLELEACYGRSDAESVERVKALYDTLEMPLQYHQYEEESYLRLQNLIQQHAQNLPHAVFLNFAKKIYKRNK